MKKITITGAIGNDKSIREGNCRKIVRIGDYKGLEDGIIKYYNDRKKCREDGLNGRKYFEENFDRKIATKKYIEVIEKVLES